MYLKIVIHLSNLLIVFNTSRYIVNCIQKIFFSFIEIPRSLFYPIVKNLNTHCLTNFFTKDIPAIKWTCKLFMLYNN